MSNCPPSSTRATPASADCESARTCFRLSPPEDSPAHNQLPFCGESASSYPQAKNSMTKPIPRRQLQMSATFFPIYNHHPTSIQASKAQPERFCVPIQPAQKAKAIRNGMDDYVEGFLSSLAFARCAPAYFDVYLPSF